MQEDNDGESNTLPHAADLLSDMDPELAREFVGDLLAAQEAVKAGVSAGRAQGYETGWRQWEKCCAELGIDPFFKGIEDKVEKLQLFAVRLRSGKLAPEGNPIKS